MVDQRTKDFAKSYGDSLNELDVPKLMTHFNKDLVYDDYMIPLLNMDFPKFQEVEIAGFKDLHVRKCNVVAIHGASISDSQTTDDSAVTVVEWDCVSEIVNSNPMTPYQVGTKLHSPICSLWWWKDGKIVRSKNYGKWEVVEEEGAKSKA